MRSIKYATLLAPIYLDILADAVQPRLNQIPRNSQIIVRHDIDGADFGTLISCDGVPAQQFHAHVADDNGEASRQHPNERIDVQLDDDPSENPRDAHQTNLLKAEKNFIEVFDHQSCCQTYQNDCLRPVVNVKAFFPVKSESGSGYVIKLNFNEG